MRARGETTRSLGKAVGATSGAVTGWTKGAAPRPDVTKRIADHFGVPVDLLLDDSRDLPEAPEPIGRAKEEQAHYGLVEKPLKTAAALAFREHGATPAGQTAFERHRAELAAMRAKAERDADGDLGQALRLFDDMLAAYLAALDQRENPPSP